MIPQIYSKPDYIIYGSQNRQGKDCIVFAKNLSDGTTIFIEEIRTGKKTLSADTIYKLSGTRDVTSIARIPSLYAQRDTRDIKIVDVSNEIVNTRRKHSL